ncbi:MAG TPA: tetratricopeptide repeat protein [Thermoanaerobaculia bacterium]|nr:tetratricopeptide repeat protein [Thermoanaerobaculia bacterium]
MRAKTRALAGLSLAALLGAAAGCRERNGPSPAAATTPTLAPRTAGATFVGRATCAPCHAEQERRWTGSHHDLAMQEATGKTILGNFDGASFTHFGVTSTFFKRDGKFLVRTDGPDGKLHEYPVAYTFGVFPLQQYLIAFPGGRYQALNVVWDTRPKAEGGQRWFHLFPKEAVPHDDPLHWTGPYQNWNYMCADCHSTNVKKGYSAASNTYATTWSELDVSCEACHGPGSAHVAWGEAVKAGKANAADADKGLAVALANDRATWDFDLKTGIAKRSAPLASHAEIETCGRCHARRSVVTADYVYGQPLMQTHRPALLSEGLYYPDGQIEDEVYEYGSFRQSKMYAAGVTCSNCHDPHDLKVKGSADRVCGGCHQPEKFDNPQHTFHKTGSAGAKCVACHMPTRDYMVVHARHDHSMRIPRPDLSTAIGAPNACVQCHEGKSNQWASDAALRWWGDRLRKEPTYGETIHAAQEEFAGSDAALQRLVEDSDRPTIRRATAASLLGRNAGSTASAALARALGDSDPIVRDGALTGAEALEPAARLPLVSPLLRDPIRTVRIDAARTLASVPKDTMNSSERASFDAALAEYVQSQQVDADRAEAHLNLAGVAVEQGDLGPAETEYRTAVALMPALAVTYVNFADLYRMTGREDEAEKILRQGLAAAPRDPGIHHALGLTLVRRKRMPEALKELEKAAALPPERARYAYVYGVALDSTGQTGRALEVLAAAHTRFPGNREILSALASFSAKARNWAAAIGYAKELLELDPQDPEALRLLDQLTGKHAPGPAGNGPPA